MALSAAQLAQFKAAIKADILANFPGQTEAAIAAAYNALASPTFWVWRSSVPETDYTRLSAVDSDGVTVTNWSWTVYINRAQGERDAWPRLFMGGSIGCNPSLANVRQAFTDIFSGAGGATQRTHLAAVSRRAATRLEKLLATGTGTAVTPATFGFEGVITDQNVSDIVNG